MKFRRALIVLGTLLFTGYAVAQTDEEPRYKLDKAQSRVVEVTNLYPTTDCSPGGSITGRVVKRVFDDEQGTLVRGFTIEHSDGSRSYINIDEEPVRKASAVTAGWVIPALQTLLKEGQRVSVGVKLCGAAGRVVMADSIRPQHGR